MAGTIKHEWNGTVLTITSDSGTSSADLKGEKGDDGARGAQGKPGGTCFEVQQVLDNIIDNGYFPAAFVINQRRQTSYTGNKYSIDRWRAYHADTTHEITAEGVKVSSSGNNPNMYQVIERHKIDTNKTYTAAALDAEGNIYLRVGTPTTTSYANCCLYISGNNVLFRLNGARTWVWAALYEGEYTENEVKKYFYKGYAAELAECQRYYWRYSNNNGMCVGYGYMNNATTANITFNYPVNMRTNPTVSIGDISTLRLMCSDGLKGVIEFSILYSSYNQITLAFTTNSNGTAYTPCVMRSNSGTSIEFSAEL